MAVLRKTSISRKLSPFMQARQPLMRAREWMLDTIKPLPKTQVAPKAELKADDNDFKHLGFTFAFIALSVKLAKLGGSLTREEYLAFHALFAVSDEDCPKLRRLFAYAWADTGTAAAYARQIMYLYPARKKLHHKVLERLCMLSTARGAPDKKTLDFLHDTARIFGLNRRELGALLERHLHAAEPDPYAVLGLAKSASKEEVKARYRQLMRRYHPDTVMHTARYPETLALALSKATQINNAYGKLTA